MIPFTQYHLPDGRKEQIELAANEKTTQRANELIAAGCHFDMEVLRTEMVSLTCEKDDLDDPLVGIQLCSKDTAMIFKTVEKLVNESYRTMKKGWEE